MVWQVAGRKCRKNEAHTAWIAALVTNFLKHSHAPQLFVSQCLDDASVRSVPCSRDAVMQAVWPWTD